MMFFNKDILQFLALREVCRGLLEDYQLFISFRQLAFETCNLGRYLQLTFRGGLLILLFTEPVVELCFIQAEFTGYGSNTDAFFFVILVRGQSPYKTPALFFQGSGSVL